MAVTLCTILAGGFPRPGAIARRRSASVLVRGVGEPGPLGRWRHRDFQRWNLC